MYNTRGVRCIECSLTRVQLPWVAPPLLLAVVAAGGLAGSRPKLAAARNACMHVMHACMQPWDLAASQTTKKRKAPQGRKAGCAHRPQALPPSHCSRLTAAKWTEAQSFR